MENLQHLTDGQQAIKNLLDQRIGAIKERNVGQIIGLYDKDPVVFNIMGPLQSTGTAPIQTQLEKWFSGYQGDIKQEIRHLTMATGGYVAYSHCLMRTYGRGQDNEMMDMWYRVTTTYRKEGGGWLITHEHYSEPIDMESGRGIFDAQP